MSKLETIQQEIADRISADPFFTYIPVLVEQLKDYESEFERALGPVNAQGGKTGACVTILTPTADVEFPEVGGPEFSEIPIYARVQENREVNMGDLGTQQSALAISEQICAVLHQFFPQSATGPLVCRKPTIVRGADDEFVNYKVRFKTRGGLSGAITQLPQPQIVNNGGFVTINPGTAGAAVFYTLDGRNPVPRTGTLYTAPFAPPPGARLTVRAWLAGYLASQPLTIQL